MDLNFGLGLLWLIFSRRIYFYLNAFEVQKRVKILVIAKILI